MKRQPISKWLNNKEDLLASLIERKLDKVEFRVGLIQQIN